MKIKNLFNRIKTVLGGGPTEGKKTLTHTLNLASTKPEKAQSVAEKIRKRARGWNIKQLDRFLRRNKEMCRQVVGQLKHAESEAGVTILKARLHNLLLVQNILLAEVAIRVMRGGFMKT
jgi:hypothetical protein